MHRPISLHLSQHGAGRGVEGSALSPSASDTRGPIQNYHPQQGIRCIHKYPWR